jgi:hypothetical protein
MNRRRRRERFAVDGDEVILVVVVGVLVSFAISFLVVAATIGGV